MTTTEPFWTPDRFACRAMLDNIRDSLEPMERSEEPPKSGFYTRCPECHDAAMLTYPDDDRTTVITTCEAGCDLTDWRRWKSLDLTGDEYLCAMNPLYESHLKRREESDKETREAREQFEENCILPLTPMEDWQTAAHEKVPMAFLEGMDFGTVSEIVGGAGSNKSTLADILAVSKATEKALLPGFTPDGGGNVLVANSEDIKPRVAKRLLSICQAYSIEPAEIDATIADGRLEFMLGDSMPLLEPMMGGGLKETDFFHELKFRCLAKRYALVIVDPMIDWTGIPDENKSTDMATAFRTMKQLASACGGAVLIIHHANKESIKGGELEMGAGRGSGAQDGAVRWQATMRNLTKKDAKFYGIDRADLVDYCELGVTKASYTRRSGLSTIFKRDHNGIPIHVDLRESPTILLADAIVAEIATGKWCLTAYEAPHGKAKKATEFRAAIAKATHSEPKASAIEKAVRHALDCGRLAEKLCEERRPGAQRKELIAQFPE